MQQFGALHLSWWLPEEGPLQAWCCGGLAAASRQVSARAAWCAAPSICAAGAGAVFRAVVPHIGLPAPVALLTLLHLHTCSVATHADALTNANTLFISDRII
jgi:hypothetical protein